MRLCRARIALAVAFIATVASSVSAQSVRDKPPPFSPGETLNYEVSWSMFSAGKITASLTRDTGATGHAYLVTTTAHSEGFPSLLYKVQDEFQSVFNPQTLCSIKILKQINEGSHHRLTRITFSRSRGMAILDEHYLDDENKPPKHDEHAIPRCAQDIVSAFYYVRSQPLRVGDKISFAVNDGSKTKNIVAVVKGRRKIQTPLGPREALRVVPSIFGNLYEKKKGKMVIWFSDDAYHFPLRIRVTLKMGAITGTLTSVSPAPPGYAPPGKSEQEAKSAQSASAVK